MAEHTLEEELERRLDALGYELVELERVGSRQKPVLRLRIDRAAGTGPAPEPDAAVEADAGDAPQSGVSLEDCRRVSRELESYLDERSDLSDRYVLEVSSPGVERPLVRRRDFERFAGQEVALRGKAPLAGRSRRLEGELIGIRGEAKEERVRLRLADGEEIEVPRGEITRAHLVFRWGGGGRPS